MTALSASQEGEGREETARLAEPTGGEGGVEAAGTPPDPQGCHPQEGEGDPSGNGRDYCATALRQTLNALEDLPSVPHVGVTGTERGASLAQLLTLGGLLTASGAEWLHHGDCVGADAQAHGVARSLGLRVYVHPPEAASRRAWCSGDSSERPAPYLVRDRMLVSRVGLLVALPLGVLHGRCREGTCATARQAVRTGVPVLEVRPNGLALPWPPPVRSGP